MDVEKRYAELIEENHDLREHITQAAEYGQKLLSTNHALQRENNELSIQLSKFTKDYEELERLRRVPDLGHIGDMEIEIARLISENSSLSDMNDKLKNEISKLQSMAFSIQASKDALNKQIDRIARTSSIEVAKPILESINKLFREINAQIQRNLLTCHADKDRMSIQMSRMKSDYAAATKRLTYDNTQLKRENRALKVTVTQLSEELQAGLDIQSRNDELIYKLERADKYIRHLEVENRKLLMESDTHKIEKTVAISTLNKIAIQTNTFPRYIYTQ